MYSDGGVLFCQFCAHSVDYTRIDTIKDHVKSKKHLANKEAKRQRDAAGTASSSTCTRQTTLGAMMKSKDLRESFVLDFVKMCTVADIPLKRLKRSGHFCKNTANKQELYHKQLPFEQLTFQGTLRLIFQHFWIFFVTSP